MSIRELDEPDFVLCSKCQRSVEREDINGGVCDCCSRKWYGERTTQKYVIKASFEHNYHMYVSTVGDKHFWFREVEEADVFYDKHAAEVALNMLKDKWRIPSGSDCRVVESPMESPSEYATCANPKCDKVFERNSDEDTFCAQCKAMQTVLYGNENALKRYEEKNPPLDLKDLPADLAVNMTKSTIFSKQLDNFRSAVMESENTMRQSEVERRDYLTPDKRQSMEICVQAVFAGIEYQILKRVDQALDPQPVVFGAMLTRLFGFQLDFSTNSRGTVIRQDGYALIVPHLTDLFGSHESLTENQLNSVQAIWSGIRYALYERYETKEMNDNYKVGFGVMLAKAYEYDLNDLGQVVTRTSGRSVLGKHEVEVLMREFRYGNNAEKV